MENLTNTLSFDMNSLKLPSVNQDYILKLNNSAYLKFFKDELTIKYVGKGFHNVDFASVQSNKPINKQNPIFYYEVEILDEGARCDISIGFSDKDFLQNKQVGTTSKSFGFSGEGKIFHNKTKGDPFSTKFKVKDVVGCGYHLSKKSIFYTLNGRFLGWAFKEVEFNLYFPTISLHSLNEKVTVNFGKKAFLFDLEGFYIKQMMEKINNINQESINLSDLDYLVREYLVHSGYQETFNALESESPSENLNSKVIDGLVLEKNQSMNLRKDSLYDELAELAANKEKNDELSLYETSKIIRKYSDDPAPELKQRSLSMMIERINDEKNDNQNGSKPSDIFIIINFLEERKVIQNMIAEKKYEEAQTYFEKHFEGFVSKNELNFKRIVLCLVCLKFFENLRNSNYMEAYNNLTKLDQGYWNKNITISLYDQEEKIYDYCLEELSVLLCYVDGNSENLKYFLQDKQSSLISNQINSLILEFAGLSKESVLEKIVKQHILTTYVYKSIKNSFGENLSIKI